MNKEEKSIKALLNSGVPLENDILCICKNNFSFRDISSDYEFETLDQGKAVTRSIDFKVSSINNSDKIPNWLNFALECKYHQACNSWYFFQYNFQKSNSINGNALRRGVTHAVRKRNLFIRLFTLNHRGWSYKLDKFEKKANLFLKNIPLTWKGVHVTPNHEANTTTIKEGIYQLQGAIPNIVFENYDFAYPASKFGDRDHYIIPILITTADLYVSNSNINLKNLNKNKNCFRKVPYLLLFQNLTKEKQSHNLSLFKNYIQKRSEEYEDFLKTFYKKVDENQKDHKNKFIKQNIDNIIELVNFYPHIYLIVNFNSFKTIIDRIQKIFN